jgi:hypothetical protein
MRIFPVPLAVVCLAAGGIGGWFLHGARPPRAASSENSGGVSKSAAHGDANADPEPDYALPPRPRLRDIPENDSPDGKDEYSESLQADLKWKLSSWKSGLGLRPDQVAALEEAIKKSVAATAAESDSDEPPVSSPQNDLEVALAGILDPAQAAKFQSWKERREQVQHESKATAKLAEMEDNLILDPDQREAIRKSLLEHASSEPPADNHSESPMIDPQMITDLNAKLGDGMDDPKQFQSAAKAWIDQHIATEMEQMKAYLRPDQLETYRHLLDRKYAGWLEEGP